MEKITTLEQANELAKQLIADHDNIEAVASQVAEEYDGKLFWQVSYQNMTTGEPVKMMGSIAYIADNGKVITFSSNPTTADLARREEILLREYGN